MLSPPKPDRLSESLSAVVMDKGKLTENGLCADPQHSILRTRFLHAMNDRGWKRIAITSHTHGCGKTFIATTAAPAAPCC